MHNDNNNAMSKYLVDVGRSQPLSADEERTLSERIARGDKRAADILATANLRLVVAVAAKYAGKGLEMDDMVCEGNIGLLKAAARYDASHGRFSSYATPIIRHHIEQAIAYANGPTIASQADSDSTARRQSRKYSMDAPLGGRENVNLLSLLVNPDAPTADTLLADKMLTDAVSEALGVLNDRERAVMQAFLGLGVDRKTMAEIGQAMGLKRERVRQIRDKAVIKVKKQLRHGSKNEV